VILRRLAAALLLAAAIAAQAPSRAQAQPAVTPPGSAFGLVPPPGFVVDRAFTGFADPARPGSSIVFSEMPPTAYARIEQGMTAEALARSGIELAARESFATPVGTGLLITGTQRAGDRVLAKWMLVVPAAAGEETATGLVVATLPAPVEPATDGAIRAALAGLTFTPLSLEQKLAALPFRVTEGPTLKVGQTLAGSSAILTPGGRPGGPGAPLIAVAFAPGVGVAPAERATAALVLSRQLGGLSEVRRSPPAESGDTLRIDGTGRTRDGTARRFTQWVVFLPDGHLRVLAMADEDRFGEFAAEFDGIAASVARR
jgi:hypothetical protein